MATFYARGDLSNAKNPVINPESLQTTPVTLIEFAQSDWDAILAAGTTGTFTVYVDDGNGGLVAETHEYEIVLYGYLPKTKKFNGIGGQDLRGDQIAVIYDTTTGQRYFFLTDPENNTSDAVMLDFGTGGVVLESVTVICFLRGTLIDTAGGPKPVEDLLAGDLVVTDTGLLPIAWVGSRTHSLGELALNPRLVPITIAANAFGPGIPSAPLSLSPDHRVVLEGAEVELAMGAPRTFCAAKFLTGRPGVTQALPDADVEYFHILLSSHRILTANGLECESLSHGPRAREALGDALCDRLVADGVLQATEGRSPLPVLRQFEALALA